MDVVIVNHNTRELLRQCVTSVIQDQPDRVLVVDTDSVDGSVSMLRGEFPGVDVIEMSNSGYGAAANRGVQDCSGDYVLLLNADTRIQPQTLKVLSGFFERNRRAAVVAPKLIGDDGCLQRSCRRFPGSIPWLLDNRRSGHLARRLPWLRNHILHAWPHDSDRMVPWAIGAALAFRRQSFLSVNGFDERFFLYLEEVDLCMRLRASRWQVWFTPAASVVHVGGASTSRYQPDAVRAQLQAATRLFYRKHYSFLRAEALDMVSRLNLRRNHRHPRSATSHDQQ